MVVALSVTLYACSMYLSSGLGAVDAVGVGDAEWL
jgi:hypothetical protein